MNIDIPLMIRDSEARKLAGNPSRTTWWRWGREGVIPPAIKIGRCNFRSTIELIDTLKNLGCLTEITND
jgi:hypothetical protein